MKKLLLLKMLALAAIATFITSFTTSGKTTTAESGYYYFYYEMAVQDFGKWVYISDVAYGERPGSNLTVPNNTEKQRFTNRVKSRYADQLSADKYYIDERINYEFKTTKENLTEKRNNHIESAKRNGYKVFYVQL